MKKGYVRITSNLIEQALQFPGDWQIEDIKPSINESGEMLWGDYTMLISGDAFPEISKLGRTELVSLIIHKEATRFEVVREEKPIEPHMKAFEEAIKTQIHKNEKARYPETEEHKITDTERLDFELSHITEWQGFIGNKTYEELQIWVGYCEDRHSETFEAPTRRECLDMAISYVKVKNLKGD